MIHDVDRDGDLDILAAYNHIIYIFENDSQGNFLERSCPVTIQNNLVSHIWFPASHDNQALDSNSLLMAAINNQGAIFQLTPDSSIHNIAELRLLDDAVCCDFGDLDLDGDFDLLVGNREVFDYFYINDENNPYETRVASIDNGNKTLHTQFVDIDLDGDLDMIHAGRGGSIAVFYNDLPVRVKEVLPAQNSHSIRRDTSIDVTLTHPIHQTPEKGITVHGSRSGCRAGRIQQLDSHTLRFHPAKTFFAGEDVQVSLTEALFAHFTNKPEQPFVYQFQTRSEPASMNFQVRSYPTKIDNLYSHYDIDLADLDSDGDIDALVSVESGGQTIFLNDGNGYFDKTFKITGPVNRIHSQALGDIDNDGDLDLAVSNFPEMPNRLYINNGLAKFHHAINFELGLEFFANAAMGDVNGDGFNDLLLAGSYLDGNMYKLYFNQGGGKFDSSIPLPFNNNATRTFHFHDIDRDGDLDLVVNSPDTNQIFYYPNQGKKHYNAEKLHISNRGGEYIFFGDIDNDGSLDLVCAVIEAIRSQHFIYTIKNIKNGRRIKNYFLDRIRFNTLLDNNIRDAWLGDIDGDGDLDYIESTNNEYNNRSLVMFLNYGDGSYAAGITVLDGSQEISFDVGDIDGDGDLDLVILEKNGNIKALINE